MRTAPTLLLTLAALALEAPAAAAAEDAAAARPFETTDGAACASRQAIRVTVTRINKIEGFIVADLHDDVPDDFLKSDKVRHRVRHPVEGETESFCIPIDQPGDYAVGVYHDRNSNQEFDKNFLRIPKERFGTSGNPEFGLSAPDYHECAIPVGSDGVDITIELVSARDIL